MMYTMTIYNVSYDGDPSRDCLNFLHAAWKHAGLFFLQNMENSGSLHGNIL